MHLLAGPFSFTQSWALFLVRGGRPRVLRFFTLMLAAAFVVGGVFRIVTAVSHRFHGWVWVLINGVITLVLGILIWQDWPASAIWVIGLFVGIDMVFAGMSWVMTALTVRGVIRDPV